MQFKDNLRMLRKRAGLTQAQLAERLHMKQYSISDYELGRTEPTIRALNRIADYFSVSVDLLLGRGKKIPTNDDDVNEYIAQASMDRCLIEIYEEIKGLSPEAKRRVLETIRFTKRTFLSDEGSESVDSDPGSDEISDLVARNIESD